MGLFEEAKDSLPDEAWTVAFTERLRESDLKVSEAGGALRLFITDVANGKYHTMCYPCRESGFVTSWNRKDFFCGNGDSHEAAIEDAKQSVMQVECADYEDGADVVYKPLGIKAKITEVLAKDDGQRVLGRRYEVGFFNDNGALEAVKYCRQSELEKVA